MRNALFSVLVLGAALAANPNATASAARSWPDVVLSYPGKGMSVPRSELVAVVVEHESYSIDGQTVAKAELVSYANTLLKSKPLGVICVYAREGASFGDVVRGVDLLRETTATSIAVSRNELPYGSEP